MTVTAPLGTKAFDRARWMKVADGLAIAVAVSLPWSTTATGALIALWLLALVPTITLSELRREIANPACGLPVLLWALVIVGMLWSEASLAERLDATKGLHKLLVIPLLVIHFRHSDKGYWVLAGFLASCTVLLAVSWALHYAQVEPSRHGPPGVPVKDYIVQSAEFLISAFACGHLALDAWHSRRRALALAMIALALLFLANIAFVATGRTALVAFAVLLLLFGVQRFGWKGALGLAIGGVLFAALIWASSPYLRGRALGVVDEMQRYHSGNAETSAGFRLEFWKKSIAFIAEAPMLGHGTGSIPLLFRRAAVGDAGIAAAITGNPHNQTLEVAIQFGLIGVALLYAMWMAHFLMFYGGGLPGWVGQAVVLQAVVGCLFLSYLFDFSSGWTYVLGVGVLGGIAGKRRAPAVHDRDFTGSPPLGHLRQGQGGPPGQGP
jgi:O-antigen ligase